MLGKVLRGGPPRYDTEVNCRPACGNLDHMYGGISKSCLIIPLQLWSGNAWSFLRGVEVGDSSVNVKV